ncbi:unnamed protein product [Arctogadus glacialis]
MARAEPVSERGNVGRPAAAEGRSEVKPTGGCGAEVTAALGRRGHRWAALGRLGPPAAETNSRLSAAALGPGSLWSQQPGASSLEPAAWSQQPGASSLEPQQPGASSLEPQQPGASSLEPAAWSQQPGASSLDPPAWTQPLASSLQPKAAQYPTAGDWDRASSPGLALCHPQRHDAFIHTGTADGDVVGLDFV